MPDTPPVPQQEGGFFSTAPGIATSILAPALAGAAVTGLTSSRIPARPGEDPEERRSRILRNAIVGGVLGGGAGGLGNLAFNSLNTAMPFEDSFDRFLGSEGKGNVYNRGGVGALLGGLLGGLGKSEPERAAHTMAVKDVADDWSRREQAAAAWLSARPGRQVSQLPPHLQLPVGGKAQYLTEEIPRFENRLLFGSTNPHPVRRGIGRAGLRGKSIGKGALTGAALTAGLPWFIQNFIQPALDNE